MSTLSEVAAKRGLHRLADAFDDYARKGWVAESTVATAPLPDDTVPLLSYLSRHGLEPRAVRTLASEFEDRPLELGLLAWDALSGFLGCAEDDEYLSTLRKWARPVAQNLPGSGDRGFPVWAISPIEAAAAAAAPAFATADDERLLAGAATHAIGAYERYRQTNAMFVDVLRTEGFLRSTGQTAHLLDLAHLPTLASFYQGYLYTAFAERDVFEDLCESLLDAGAAELPLGVTDAAPDWIAYVMARKLAVDGHALRAKAMLAATKVAASTPETRGAAGVRLLAADLQVMFGGQAENLSEVGAIVQRYPLWRFASRVRSRLLARALPKQAVPSASLFDSFVTTFGNDRALGYALLVETAHKSSAWLEPVVRRLAAEAFAQPHDIEVWYAFAQFLDDDSGTLINELKSAVATQSLLVD